MNPRRALRRLAAAALAGAVALFAALPASAQCAMCGLSNNGRDSRTAFLHGAIVLLVPVVLVIGGLSWLTWRLRDPRP